MNLKRMSAKQRRAIYRRRRIALAAMALAAVGLVVCLASVVAGFTDESSVGVYADSEGSVFASAPETTTEESTSEVTSEAIIPAYSEWVNTSDGQVEDEPDPYAIPEANLIDVSVNAPYAVLYDVANGRVLYAKNAEDRCYPASTTKIMTASLALEYAPAEYIFYSGDEQRFVNAGSSLAYFNEGRSADLRMTIEALMIPSGNDAAYVVAANIGRLIEGREDISAEAAVESFITKMNERAWEAGAENTHFANPDGWHDDNHYTTPLDLVKITMYSKQFPMIAEVATQGYVERFYGNGEETAWVNSNSMIKDTSDFYYQYSTGLKTGMTDEAGYCVVSTAEKDGNELICVIMKSVDIPTRWRDVRALFEAGFEFIESEESSAA